jgi:hypothetical protein
MKFKTLQWKQNTDPLAYGLFYTAKSVGGTIDIYDEDKMYAVIFENDPDSSFEKTLPTIDEAKSHAQKVHEKLVKEIIESFVEKEK